MTNTSITPPEAFLSLGSSIDPVKSVFTAVQVALALSLLLGFGDRQKLQDMQQVATVIQASVTQVKNQETGKES